MAEIVIFDRKESEFDKILIAAAVDESGNHLSTGGFRFCDTRYGIGYIRTMTAFGISTPVQHRRGGNIRKMFSYMFEQAAKEGAAVAILHPFSFSYYRMFGYEKVADHLIIRFPLRMLDFVPRRCNLVKYCNPEKQLSDLLYIYNTFSFGRNLMFARHTGEYYNDRETYIYYENGQPAGYVSFRTKNEFVVNHMANGILNVFEIAYTTSSAFREIMSFLRMFEGEMDTIQFENCAMCPEVELLLCHYTHTEYHLVPDIMARVLDTEKILLANCYPDKAGCFTVRVDDTLERTRGVYHVKYGSGSCEVQRLDDSANSDLTLSIQAFTRLVYGYDGITSASAAYMDGVLIERPCEDFFRAFPKRPCGIFEHF